MCKFLVISNTADIVQAGGGIGYFGGSNQFPVFIKSRIGGDAALVATVLGIFILRFRLTLLN